jgi:hypothetical protein
MKPRLNALLLRFSLGVVPSVLAFHMCPYRDWDPPGAGDWTVCKGSGRCSLVVTNFRMNSQGVTSSVPELSIGFAGYGIDFQVISRRVVFEAAGAH